MVHHDHYFTLIFNCTCTFTDAPDLKIMMLPRAWTQAGIDTLKTDARATRVLQFVRDEVQMTEEERVLTQAGKELVDNTTHHIDDVETRAGTTIQWYEHLKGIDIDTNRMKGLTNMEYYTRLIDYAQKNGGYVQELQRGSKEEVASSTQ